MNWFDSVFGQYMSARLGVNQYGIKIMDMMVKQVKAFLVNFTQNDKGKTTLS